MRQNRTSFLSVLLEQQLLAVGLVRKLTKCFTPIPTIFMEYLFLYCGTCENFEDDLICAGHSLGCCTVAVFRVCPRLGWEENAVYTKLRKSRDCCAAGLLFGCCCLGANLLTSDLCHGTSLSELKSYQSCDCLAFLNALEGCITRRCQPGDV